MCVLAQVILENAKALRRAGVACSSKVAGDESSSNVAGEESSSKVAGNESSSKVAGEEGDHFACSRLPVSAHFHVVDAARYIEVNLT